MANFHFSPRPNRANEIRWSEWSEEAFAEARAQDKPVLLGISAVWCHWCHVMDETSYSDAEVIRLINERFIPIRVDNDQRPDVNRRYNLGGWPTTAFLTPDGEILTGGTYIPPEQMRGYLTQVSQTYTNSKSDILHKLAEVNAKREQAQHTRAASKAGLSPEIVENVLRNVLDNFDALYGGLGDEPKFPHADAIELVLEKYHATRDESLLPVVTITLTKMASGGMYDREAGGFFRYSTTRDWSVPHFEKMLEDNARLLMLYVHAHQVALRGDAAGRGIPSTDTQSPLARASEIFLKTIQSLIAYVNSTLSDRVRGGFYGSQDADEHYYALPLAERASPTAPYVDRTIYTDWNALMVSAYLEAASASDEASLQEFALKSLERVWNEAYRGDDTPAPGESERAGASSLPAPAAAQAGLFHFLREGGPPQVAGLLGDLAHLSRASLDAYQATGAPVHLRRGQRLADHALATLYDTDGGAFWSERRGDESLGLLRVPDKSLNENAAMAEVLTRLYRLTRDEKYREGAEKSLEYFGESFLHYGFAAADYARAVDHFLNEPVTVHIVGAVNDARAHELHAAALGQYAPAKIVQLIDPARDAARLAQLGYPANTTPMAYVCVGQKCLAPVSDAAGIVRGMRELA